jgi:hypothetical protein
MTPLRQRMIREMQLRQFSPCTIESYQTAVIGLSQFYHRSPDQLNLEQIRGCNSVAARGQAAGRRRLAPTERAYGRG